MYAIGRTLQTIGLIILPLAMFAQLANRISASEMLKFLVVGVMVFGGGYLMQSYSGRSDI